MLRLVLRLTILNLLMMILLIALSDWFGRLRSDDAFLYLTQLNDEERNAAIYAFDTRTGITQIILKQPDILDFTVSPEGQFLLYRKRENRETAFYLLDLYNGNTQLLLFGNIDTPRWSPDGEWIAFRNLQHRERGLYIISPNGGESQHITEQSFGIYSWSEDSQYLIYAQQLESNWGIFSVSISTYQVELLTTFEGYLTGLEGRGYPVLAIVDSLPQHFDFVSGEYEVLSERMVFSGHPTWSPNGKRWAFISMSPSRSDWGLTIYNTEGEFLALYHPPNLSISSPIVWWLSK